ncbi:MAG: DUF2946 family protein [Beijerinckiaceae bacterium]|jgi:hypothetical protein
MRRHGFIGVFLCVLAVWVQFMVPVAAATLESNDPAGAAIICSTDHASQTSDGDRGGLPPASPHHYCPLCQVCLTGGLIPERPAFTALDYPTASPLRWHIAAERPEMAHGHNPGQPRGPPSIV